MILGRSSPVGGISSQLCLAFPAARSEVMRRVIGQYRILPDRGVPVVHELVAVVFEFLAKVIQHGPGLMTGRTAQTVLAGEGRKGIRLLAGPSTSEKARLEGKGQH